MPDNLFPFPEEHNHVRVGVSYSDRTEGVSNYPYGIKWVEVGGVRLQALVKKVTAEYETNEFGEVTIVLAGATFEEVDAQEGETP